MKILNKTLDTCEMKVVLMSLIQLFQTPHFDDEKKYENFLHQITH